MGFRQVGWDGGKSTPNQVGGFVKFTFWAPGWVASQAEILEVARRQSWPDFALRLFNLTMPLDLFALDRSVPEGYLMTTAATRGAFRQPSDHIETKTPSDLQQRDRASLYPTDRHEPTRNQS
jgi:hypothetical protein